MKQLFEISRVAGKYPADQVTSIFDKFGVVVLKEYLPKSIRQALRTALTNKLERSRARGNVIKYDRYPWADFLLGDVLSIRELESYDYIFFRSELIEVFKNALRTPELVYYGDSSTQFDAAERGYHKDNTERYDANSNDWVGDYGILRAAFYCEDHSGHSGGLKVRIGSHNVDACRSKLDPNKISAQLGKPVDIRSEFGDLVFWNMRLTHSGNFRKLRFLPQLVLHPRLEMALPNMLFMPEQDRRYFLSCAFARPGVHLDCYIEKFDSRAAEVRRYLETARRPQEVALFLAARGVTFRKPVDYFGIDDNDA